MNEGLYYLAGALPATPSPSQEQPPWEKTEVVGKALPRVDAYERVSGTAEYPSDVALPGMLYGAILRCPHAHARVRSVDTRKAQKMPGVWAVATDSTPGADLTWYSAGDKPIARLFDPHCRFAGEAVAAVAAETPYQAWDAVRAIAVDYEVLPFVVDEEEALAPGAPEVRDGGNRAGEPQVYERGVVSQGFAEADVVLEENYRTACMIHTTLEPHGCVARWDGNKLTVWESSQGVYRVQSRLARAFDLPLSHVRVIGHYVGGGFGSKLATGKFSPIAALLARRTARPVRLFLTREETFLCTGNRPANVMRLKAGVKKDGTLTALEFEGLGSGGAYSGSGTGILDWQIRDLYRCPNVRTECHNVFIHAGPQRPMRAPGHPQGSWALEQIMDALAEKIGMDPVELRLRNLTGVSQARAGSPPYTSTGFKECLERGAEEFGWSQARSGSGDEGALVRGVGMAGCLWVAGAGGPPSTAIVKYFADGSANLNMGASDIGTGTKTVMAMVVAEELGVAVDRIQIEHADTGTTQWASASGGSKTVPTDSPAVRAAAVDCRDQLLAMAAEQLEVPASELTLKNGEVISTKNPEIRAAVGDVEAFEDARIIVGIGYRGPNPEGKATCPFGAQFCEVEVNTRTGEVRVVRFLGAHDSGRVMNRKTYDNQVYGGIAMGIGFATTERRVLDRNQTGKMVNDNWHDYKIPTAMDVPAEIVSVAIDPGDTECNTTGAKGLGEPVTIPTAAAVANAVYHATGVRVTETPINPTRLLEGLVGRKQAGNQRRS
ncbi:MAG: xanthine dehydrogenase family protein molybdopterin-binding subunit [bacterium]|nr:xanthine dehydrogenase family protein molybdopterin-binding subunit [bacterium]